MKLSDLIARYLIPLAQKLGILKFESDDDTESTIPDKYLERFDLSPAFSKDQVDGRDPELEAIRSHCEKWENTGEPLLISGHQGTGITTLLNAACRNLSSEPVFFEDHYRISSREQLLAELAEKLEAPTAAGPEELAGNLPETRRIVIFENMERLLLRRTGGYDLLRDFLLFLSLTRRQICWIVTVNQYTRYFLDQMMGLDGFFPNVIEPKALTGEQLIRIIGRRNENTVHIFRKPKEVTWQFAWRLGRVKGEKRQEILREHFFKELTRFARGNVSRALLFWRKSVTHYREKSEQSKETIFLLPAQPRTAVLNRPDDLFVLESFWLHSSLSEADLSAVLDLTSTESRLITQRLLQQGWLHERKVRNGIQEYQIDLMQLENLKSLLQTKLNRHIP